MMYFETSAKSNINVRESFVHMIDLVYKNKFAAGGAPVEPPARNTIKLGRKSEAQAKQQ